uniref:Uncharacterized protein n=1 Tax=Avena sativa TaxID=4498 RepID=A0ACD5W6S4_AVESA
MDWSNLGDGPAGMIAERLLANDVADYIRFRAVCLPWRRCSVDPRAHGILDRRFLPRRWIMLRGKVAHPDRPRRRLLNVSTGQCVRTHLPELRGHVVCTPTVEGLLVLFNRTTYAARLLNPLTCQVSDLPPATTLYPLYISEEGLVSNFEDFTVTAAGLADDTTVAVLFDFDMLAVAKPGDEQWTLVKQGIERSAISFAGRFYCTSATDSGIQMVDIRDNQPPALVLAATTAEWNDRTDERMLLDNDGELLLLTETSRPRIPQVGYVNVYEVSRVDLDAGEMKPIRDLGGRAVFTGESYAISVSPSAFPAIKKNSVYLSNRYVVGCLIFTGPYTFVDGTTISCTTEACGFTNCIPQYGPHSIVDNLSQYVKRDAWFSADDDDSESDAEDDTSDSDAEDDISDLDVEANCII